MLNFPVEMGWERVGKVRFALWAAPVPGRLTMKDRVVIGGIQIADAAVNREELRIRLREMTNRELGRFGRAVQKMYSLETQRGNTPRQEVVFQLEEAGAEWISRFTMPPKRQDWQQRLKEGGVIPVSEGTFFHIFSGTGSEDAMWLEAVRGLECARERLNEIARKNPGRYLLFSFAGGAVLAKVDTAKNLMKPEMLRRDAA
jgi:hypothetical protein